MIPNPNPFAALVRSRKFWLMIFDVVVSLTTYFVTKYTNPDAAKDVITVLTALQAPVVFLIGAIAYEDGQAAQATSNAWARQASENMAQVLGASPLPGPADRSASPAHYAAGEAPTAPPAKRI